VDDELSGLDGGCAMNKVITRMDPYQRKEERIWSIEANLKGVASGAGSVERLTIACLQLLEIVRKLNAKVALLERHIGNL
jgi:hypothetical protein